jgi:hypothetical protein
MAGNYSRVIWFIAILTGSLYGSGYSSISIREVVGDHIPMSPPVLGCFLLFSFGAALGISVACAAAPRSFLRSRAGQEHMRADLANSEIAFRLKAFLFATFLIVVTGVVLYESFIND